MPYITVKIPSGVLGEEAKAAFVRGICAAAAECEQVPDNPKMRALCVVTIEERSASSQTFGGHDMSQAVVSFDATVNIPKGVLDDGSRARFVELLHQAAVHSLPDEKRRVATSSSSTRSKTACGAPAGVCGSCRISQPRPATGTCSILS